MARRGLFGLPSLWLLLSCLGAGALSLSLLAKTPARSLFLPGQTTHGHYQIELQCDACHTSAFTDAAAIQSACERCHADELQEAHDSHPKSKFLDPRNADRVAQLDARQCVTCHAEHVPDATRTMAVTVPEDYCYRCHQDIAKERSSHRGMAFDSCDDAGCHNFHDNRALYEDFLAQHLDEPDLRNAATPAPRLVHTETGGAVARDAFDAPQSVLLSMKDPGELVATVHSRAGVNCSGCHVDFSQPVSLDVCGKCHQHELSGFQAGRHGMRTALGLPPMAVRDARLPMKPEAHAQVLGCTSCHGAHDFDRTRAASQACEGCHADEHTRNYESSPHAELWRKEQAGALEPGLGVSCATCHLPRVTAGERQTFALHNQNANLRPSEKMVRDVCLRCHGLGFTLASLADRALVRSNFNGEPEAQVESLALVARRQSNSRTGGAKAP